MEAIDLYDEISAILKKAGIEKDVFSVSLHINYREDIRNRLEVGIYKRKDGEFIFTPDGDDVLTDTISIPIYSIPK